MEARINKKPEQPDSFKIGSGWAGSRPAIDQDGLMVKVNDVHGDDADGELDIETRKDRARIQHKWDWRGNGQNVCQAFWRGQVRSRDYHIVVSIVAAHLLTVGLAVDISVRLENDFGFVFALVPIFYSNLLSSHAVSVKETILLVVAYLMLYVTGFAQFATLNPTKVMEPEYVGSQRFLFFYCICIPYVSSVASLVLKFQDDLQEKKISKQFYGLAVVYLLNQVAFLVCMYAFYYIGFAMSYTVFMLFVIYMLCQYYFLKKNDFVEPTFFRFANPILLATVISMVVVSSIVTDSLNGVAAFSICMLVIILILSLIATLMWLNDRSQRLVRPVAYSPYIFPVFKYNPRTNQLDAHNTPATIMAAIICLLFAWSYGVIALFKPVQVGLAINCAVETFAVILLMNISTTTRNDVSKVADFVNKQTVKTAWLQAKQNFIQAKGITSRDELVSYRDWWLRRYQIRGYINAWQGKKLKKLPPASYEEMYDELQGMTAHKDYFHNKLDEWVDYDLHDLNDPSQTLAYGFEVDRDVKNAFNMELILLVQFELLILIISETQRRQYMNRMFKFVAEKRVELYVLGINVSVPKAGSREHRFQVLVSQLGELSEDERTMFNHLKEQFIADEKVLEEKQARLQEKEEAADRERQERMAEMSKQRKEAMANIDLSKPLHEIPDCRQKYDKIMAECKESGQKYSDGQFSHEEEQKVLGDAVFADKEVRQITGWKRLSEMEGAQVFCDGASYRDIVQGALGDCYFLSAISVLGDNLTRDLFVDYSFEHGVFMVRFYTDGLENFVIVDDYLPIKDNGQPSLTRGGPDGLEMWPCVLEKAYAKFYGNYSFIEAGKIQMALADMVNGFPE